MKPESAVDLVSLAGFGSRRPAELSGGQQQRVALARALVLQPAVLLLDEPLGALDAKLRKALQVELKALQEQVGITFIYVTHDQEEALTMSDRIAVMSNGRVEQVGRPQDLYEEPTTTFVADFLGVSNLMTVTARGESNGRCKVALGEFELYASNGDVSTTGETRMVIRPERVRLEEHQSTGENRIPGMVERVVYLGNLYLREGNVRAARREFRRALKTAEHAKPVRPGGLRRLFPDEVVQDFCRRRLIGGGPAGALP